MLDVNYFNIFSFLWIWDKNVVFDTGWEIPKPLDISVYIWE